ncbi:MAG: ribosome biogenesis factor YjgA [Gammaproteobacteria bacterium]|nr:ribosome biogenesis factor YjgA [Gammaproteobacteria bacterium]
MTQHDDHETDTGGEDALGPSKTRLKREAEAAQALGERLISLDDATLEDLDLPEKLIDAVRLARTMKSHGALRRQRQYIGKLMRGIDSSDISAVMEQLDQDSAAANRLQHAAEQWRERLLDEGDTALAELLDKCPTADRQQLRQLVRAAQAERKAGKAPKQQRALFRELRSLLESAV